MIHSLLRQFLLTLILLSLISDVRGDADREFDLTLSIRCPKEILKQGDEIPIVFTITNNDPLPYPYNSRKYDRSGRMSEFTLVATHQDGAKVPGPRENYLAGLGGGLSNGMETVATGQSFSKTIALNRWARITRPGCYSVVGTYSYSVPEPNVRGMPKVRHMRVVQVKSAPIEVVVSPRSYRQTGRYIKSLIEELEAITPSKKWDIVQNRQSIIARLAYTCDSRIVPVLIDLMYSNYHNNEIFEAQHAFLCYLHDEPRIKESLLRSAMARGLAPGMQQVLEGYGCTEQEFKEIISASLNSENLDILGEAVKATHEHPDDAHMSRLIEIALKIVSPKSEQRLRPIIHDWAISAIALNRTDRGVKVLRALLENPDEMIRKTTQSSIRWAYRRNPIYPKISNDKLTNELSAKALDTSDRRYVYAVIDICRSRTREGVEALKMLVDDPDQNLPILDTDAGVRAIRDLLKHPDKNIRDDTASRLKYLYQEYPGRPLRADDFPAELQKPKPRKSDD